MSTTFRLLLPRPIYDAMIAQALRELPNECCGLLAGTISKDGATAQAAQLCPLVNELRSPTEFLSEGRSMFRAEKTRREAGLEFLAVYHSHPTSAPVPSRKDLERNYSEDVMSLIISLQDDFRWMLGWRLTRGGFRPASCRITN